MVQLTLKQEELIRLIIKKSMDDPPRGYVYNKGHLALAKPLGLSKNGVEARLYKVLGKIPAITVTHNGPGQHNTYVIPYDWEVKKPVSVRKGLRGDALKLDRINKQIEKLQAEAKAIKNGSRRDYAVGGKVSKAAREALDRDVNSNPEHTYSVLLDRAIRAFYKITT